MLTVAVLESIAAYGLETLGFQECGMNRKVDQTSPAHD